MTRCSAAGLAAAAVLGAALALPGAAVVGAGQATAARAATGGGWGTAIKMPGDALLNKAGKAQVSTVSCASPGDCGAGGYYTDISGHEQAFVINETGSKWSEAEETPGTAVLNAGGRASITTVSCASPGDCGAGGYYTDSSGAQQAFVVSEAGGTWGAAQEVPGTAALNAGGKAGNTGAEVESVSCRGAGQCTAGGYYTDSSGYQQAFVVSEAGGTWGTAQEVPGTAALNAGGRASVQSVSCGDAGDCAAGGYYASASTDNIPVVQAFVATETGGTWSTAEEVPGTAALNQGGYAAVQTVSCAASGDCAAGGLYTSGTPATQAFVVSETGGTWGEAEEVPGIAALNERDFAQVNSMSCASPGDCSAVGFYMDESFVSQAFAETETNGTWGTAEEIPELASLNAISPGASGTTVSCGAPGNCGAGGFYTNSSGYQQAFVVSEAGGTWGEAEEVPGTAALNAGGDAATDSVSCAAAGTCSGGGFYTTSHPSIQAFVVGETVGS